MSDSGGASGGARLVVERKWAWAGSAWSWTVFVDDQPCGTVGNGHSVSVRVTPGHHRVVVGPGTVAQGMKSHPVEVDVADGASVSLVAQGGMWRPSLTVARRGAARPTAPGPTRSPAASPAAAPPPTTPSAEVQYSIVEVARTESPLGDETRTIDNSQSASPTSRVVRLTREWIRTVRVEVDKATTMSGSVDLSIHILDLKGGAERTVSRNYATSTEERQTFEEEVTLNIAAHTHTEVVFSWKEIRQEGKVRAIGGDYQVEIPFEVVVGLTFDQRQVDR